MNPIQNAVIGQFCLDYGVSQEELEGKDNVFVQPKQLEGCRNYDSRNAMLQFLCWKGKMVFTAKEPLLSELEAQYEDMGSAWFSQFENLKKLDAMLLPYGETLADFHHYYLPIPNVHAKEMPTECSLKWFCEEEISAFKGDDRFNEAFAFQKNYPDVLGVAVMVAGEIVAMAGASQDSPLLWQIGINTLSDFEGKGYGVLAVTALKDKVLSMGKIPFYGTVESHIASSRLAISAGFLPSWAEGYSKKIKEEG